MKNNKENSIKINCIRSKSYQDAWNLIIKKEKLQQKVIPQSRKKNEYNNYFTEMPRIQSFLTNDYMITKDEIDFGNYSESVPNQINHRNLYECFHGIINYIFYNSNGKFNIEELEFHFSGGEKRDPLSVIMNDPTRNIFDIWNIVNIFDYENVNSQFAVSSIRNAFFGVTFKRIKIKPYSYSIRSGVLNRNFSHLVSFTFEGYDEENDCWDILDERVNLNCLIPTGSFDMFFVHTTEKCYSSFKIRQIDPGNNGFWGFTIVGFDIHGIVYYNDFLNANKLSLLQNNDLFLAFNFTNTLNPLIDMSECII